MRSSLGRPRLGAEHVLGVQKIATARFPMAVVLAVQDLCLQRAQEATAADDKRFWLYTAFYVVVNTMAFLRPSELDLPKCTLHGIWSHCHTGRRARRLNLTRQYALQSDLKKSPASKARRSARRSARRIEEGIGLGAQDFNDMQRPKPFQKNSWK
jgi:hypothetical protein